MHRKMRRECPPDPSECRERVATSAHQNHADSRGGADGADPPQRKHCVEGEVYLLDVPVG